MHNSYFFTWNPEQAKLLLEDHLRREHDLVRFPTDLDGMRHLHHEHHLAEAEG